VVVKELFATYLDPIFAKNWSLDKEVAPHRLDDGAAR
jgi:hypothetical protein